MAHAIGIDLGTSEIRAAVVAAAGGEHPRASLLRLGKRELRIPSAVGLDSDGVLIAGDRARRLQITRPRSIVVAPLSLLGARFDELDLEAWAPLRLVRDARGDARVRLGDRTFSPVQLVAAQLLDLKRQIEGISAEPLPPATLTIPPGLGNLARRGLVDACTIAGIHLQRLVPSTTAAALELQASDTYVGVDEPTLAICDLGCGSFSAAVVELREGGLTVLSSATEPRTGGLEIDRRLAERLAEEAALACEKPDIGEDPVALVRLRHASERAKIDLSSERERAVHLPFLSADASGTKHLETALAQTELEERIEDLVTRWISALKRALADSHRSLGDLSDLLLIGRGAHLPLLHDRLEAALEREPNLRWLDGELAALGAARLAALLAGDPSLDPVEIDEVLGRRITLERGVGEPPTPAQLPLPNPFAAPARGLHPSPADASDGGADTGRGDDGRQSEDEGEDGRDLHGEPLDATEPRAAAETQSDADGAPTTAQSDAEGSDARSGADSTPGRPASVVIRRRPRPGSGDTSAASPAPQADSADAPQPESSEDPPAEPATPSDDEAPEELTAEAPETNKPSVEGSAARVQGLDGSDREGLEAPTSADGDAAERAAPGVDVGAESAGPLEATDTAPPDTGTQTAAPETTTGETDGGPAHAGHVDVDVAEPSTDAAPAGGPDADAAAEGATPADRAADASAAAPLDTDDDVSADDADLNAAALRVPSFRPKAPLGPHRAILDDDPPNAGNQAETAEAEAESDAVDAPAEDATTAPPADAEHELDTSADADSDADADADADQIIRSDGVDPSAGEAPQGAPRGAGPDPAPTAGADRSDPSGPSAEVGSAGASPDLPGSPATDPTPLTPAERDDPGATEPALHPHTQRMRERERGESELLFPPTITLPSSHTELFEADGDGATAHFYLHEGLRDRDDLGEYVLRGRKAIDMTFKVDANGILSLAFRQSFRGKEAVLDVIGGGGMPAEEVLALAQRERAIEEALRRQRRTQDLTIQLKATHERITKVLVDLEAGIPAGDQARLRATLKAIDDATLTGSLSALETVDERLSGLLSELPRAVQEAITRPADEAETSPEDQAKAKTKTQTGKDAAADADGGDGGAKATKSKGKKSRRRRSKNADAAKSGA